MSKLRVLTLVSLLLIVVASACTLPSVATQPPGSAVPSTAIPTVAIPTIAIPTIAIPTIAITTPYPVQKVAQDENCDEKGEEGEEGDDVPVKWASADGKVLVRWFGRAAAGLPPYDKNAENNAPTVLPGNPSGPALLTSPALSIERRTLPNGTFQALESGNPSTPIKVQRITDKGEADALIGKNVEDTDCRDSYSRDSCRRNSTSRRLGSNAREGAS